MKNKNNPVASIFLNQIGYEPDASKIVFAVYSGSQKDFSIKDKNGNVVFTAPLSAPVEDAADGIPVCRGDFSSFKQSGEFCICVNDECSRYFKIQNGIYKDFYYSILNYFYLSRCGQDIQDKKFGHTACHTTPAIVYGTGEKKDVTGGWHDAGDYGRYIVAASKTVMDLLRAYEAYPDFGDFDILSEVRFELEWMLMMQRDDGAVFHKISCWHFCAFINPQDEKDEIVLSPISTSATADFAGCLAFASGFYKEKDADFAQKLLDAAQKAQEYLDTHQDELYTNPPEITTGGYGDWCVKDERYFALCSLFNATGNKDFLDAALKIRAEQLAIPFNPEELWKRPWAEVFSWGCVAGYGTEILLKNKTVRSDSALFDELSQSVINRARDLCKRSDESCFGACNKKYFWGCNGHLADEAHALFVAYDLTGENQFLMAAERQLDYICGCNQLDLCFVTGQGVNSPKNPHHRPSGAVGSVMSGMLVGGACEGLNDHVAKEYLGGKAPACCYIDMQGSYSTNEVAIYWNSPLVYITARMMNRKN